MSKQPRIPKELPKRASKAKAKADRVGRGRKAGGGQKIDTPHLPTAQNKRVLSPEDKESRREKLRELLEQTRQQLHQAIDGDPFWHYEPSDGVVSGEGLAFLRKWLKEDDVPRGRLDCQMDVHLSEARTIAASGGNRVGKSASSAVEAFIWMTGELPKSLEGVYPKSKLPTSWPVMGRVVCVDFKTMSNTVVPTYQRWVPREYLKGGKWSEAWSSEHKVLTLEKNGKYIGSLEFMTNQQDVESFQGPERHFVIYDEEPRYDIYRENLLRMATTGVRQIFAMTPTKGLSWTYDLFSNGSDSEGRRVDWFRMPSITNKRVKLDVLDGILKDLTSYEEIKMRLLGEFVSLSGLIYGNLFNAKTHVIPPFFEGLPASRRRSDYMMVTGMDPHTVTPTAMVFCLVDREGNVYVDTCRFREADTAEVKEAWHEIVRQNGYRPGWAVADKSSNTTNIAFGGRNIYHELSRGKDAIPALRTSEKFEGSIRAGVDEIKKRLKDGRLFVVDRPENRALIQSFKTLERDAWSNEDDKGARDKIKEGKHHLHAALRYVFQYPVSFIPEQITVPEPEPVDYMVGY